MKYASIKSSGGGSAPQWKTDQPLTESKAGTAIPCPPRTSSKKPPQMNMTGVSKCKA